MMGSGNSMPAAGADIAGNEEQPAHDRQVTDCSMHACLNWPARVFSNRTRVSNGKESTKKIPKISIRVGMNVTRPGPYLGPKIAFIFGGPGTHKGRVVDDVAQMFGLTVITGEW